MYYPPMHQFDWSLRNESTTVNRPGGGGEVRKASTTVVVLGIFHKSRYSRTRLHTKKKRSTRCRVDAGSLLTVHSPPLGEGSVQSPKKKIAEKPAARPRMNFGERTQRHLTCTTGHQVSRAAWFFDRSATTHLAPKATRVFGE